MRVPDQDRSVWMNGERVAAGEARVVATDPVIQLGLGLFETLAIRDGACLDLGLHLDRLASGAGRLDARLPERDGLARVLSEAAAERPERPGWVKLIVTIDGLWIVFAGTMDLAEEGRPLATVTLPWRLGPPGPLAGLKTLNYGGHALARRYASERGAGEGLWLNHRGRFVEGSWSNLFVWRHGRLFTPSTREGLLPGIVRGRVIEAAKERGITVHDGPLRVKRLLRADHVFVTSSLRGLCPVTHLDGRPVGRPAGRAVVTLLAAAIGRRHLADSGATFP
jgi:branched-subunit amino acid aminotransferase/4-amino-4-deoxychorismate lyase